MHLFSEGNTWITESEFVDGRGNILKAVGESVISIQENVIVNHSYAEINGTILKNEYRIEANTSNRYPFESINLTLGKQKGYFDIDRKTIFSKFVIENSALNGFEVIVRDGDTCTVSGALYDGDVLINTWTAKMQVKK